MNSSWTPSHAIRLKVFLTLVCCAMAADYLEAQTVPFPTAKKAAPAAAAPKATAPAVKGNSKGQPCDADFNGDKIKDSCILSASAKAVTLTVKLKKNEEPKIIAFGVGTKAQNSFCTSSVTAQLESPVMPLDSFCPPSNKSVPCEKLRAANKPLQGLAKRGGKGLVLSDGKCDKIHVHWSETRQKFDWWRNKSAH